MVCVCVCVRLLLIFSFISHVLGTVLVSVCLVSVRPGPETHTFSFQVSRNEGSVCLETWGRGRPGQGGQGRAGAGAGGEGRAGEGSGGGGRAGQGGTCI